MIGCNVKGKQRQNHQRNCQPWNFCGDDFSMISGKSNSQGVILIT
jgi:hypothetical protein